MENALALAIKPMQVDVATPLLTASRIRAAQMQEQQSQMEMQKEAAGQFARGVAVYADKPEFAQKWAEGLDDLHARGLMPPQVYQGLRNNPSPLVLQRILAETTDPRLAFQQSEAKRAQANTDRDFGLRKQELDAKRATDPWMPGPGGGMVPRPGGPADPKYISDTVGAKDKISEQVSERQKAAEARGLNTKDPAIQQYILTGKMPREDQQPLTATDKKAIIEADEMVLKNREVITNLERALDLSKKAYYGPMAGKFGYATSLFGSEAGKATEDLSNTVTSNALDQLKAIFGGAPTEGERKILLDIQGSASKAPAVREEIYKRAMAAAKRRLDLNQRQADQIRSGSYYKPGGGSSASSGIAKQGSIPDAAIQELKKNPKTAEQFDEIFGVGAAARVLGIK